MDRHARQSKLVEIGAAGQSRIARAVVRVGLDGFAADVAVRYLAGAGVGSIQVRDGALPVGALTIDPSVPVEVDPSLAVDETGSFDLREPVVRDFCRGARVALRALRGAACGQGPAPGGSVTGESQTGGRS